MSRGTAKERSRVRIAGRVSTLRKIEEFGSWKHNHFHPCSKCPATRRFARRIIGGRNGGHCSDKESTQQRSRSIDRQKSKELIAEELALIEQMRRETEMDRVHEEALDEYFWRDYTEDLDREYAREEARQFDIGAADIEADDYDDNGMELELILMRGL